MEAETGCLKPTVGHGSWLRSTWSQFCILFFILAQRTHINTTHSKSVSLIQNWHRPLLLYEFLDLSLSIPSSLSDGVELKKKPPNGTHKCFFRWESSKHKKKSVKMDCSICWSAITHWYCYFWTLYFIIFQLLSCSILVSALVLFCGLFFCFLLQSFKAFAEVAFSSIIFVYKLIKYMFILSGLFYCCSYFMCAVLRSISAYWCLVWFCLGWSKWCLVFPALDWADWIQKAQRLDTEA